MPTDNESREQGVEFGSLADELESEQYPIDKSELLETYGDRKLELQNGGQTLREVLDPLGETTFESAGEVTQSVIGMVGDAAIGRKHYSDRGGQAPEEDTDKESI